MGQAFWETHNDLAQKQLSKASVQICATGPCWGKCQEIKLKQGQAIGKYTRDLVIYFK